MNPSRRPIETFDPLLRDLVGWGLVVRSDSAKPIWRLADAAQRRLNELVLSSAPVDAESVVYFHHRCALCREQKPTRLRQSHYLCESCLARQADIHDDVPAEETSRGSRKYMRLHWSRDKGSIAS